MLERIEKRDGAARAAAIFHCRNVWLLVIGLLDAMLIWNGKILFHHAFLALLVLCPLRSASGRRRICLERERKSSP